MRSPRVSAWSLARLGVVLAVLPFGPESPARNAVAIVTDLKGSASLLSPQDERRKTPQHFGQIFISAIPGVVSDDTMTIKVEVLDGGRIGAYAVIVGKRTLDLTFIQGRPQS